MLTEYDPTLPPTDPRSLHEQWRDVPGYEGKYQVSNHGQVKSVGRHIPVRGGKTRWQPQQMRNRQMNTGTDFWCVLLYNKGKARHHYIANLVLEAFGHPRPPAARVTYLDGDCDNLHYSNLAWSDERVVRHKTPDAIEAQVMTFLNSGISLRKTAKLFGIAYNTAWRIKHRHIAAQQSGS
jgi:hypothetical protein